MKTTQTIIMNVEAKQQLQQFALKHGTSLSRLLEDSAMKYMKECENNDS